MTHNPLQVHLGMDILAVIEDDDPTLLLVGGLITRARELLEEAGVSQERLPSAIEQMVIDQMAGDLSAVDIEAANGGMHNGDWVLITLKEDED